VFSIDADIPKLDIAPFKSLLAARLRLEFPVQDARSVLELPAEFCNSYEASMSKISARV